jgi:hypothetical protein
MPTYRKSERESEMKRVKRERNEDGGGRAIKKRKKKEKTRCGAASETRTRKTCQDTRPGSELAEERRKDKNTRASIGVDLSNGT